MFKIRDVMKKDMIPTAGVQSTFGDLGMRFQGLRSRALGLGFILKG